MVHAFSPHKGHPHKSHPYKRARWPGMLACAALMSWMGMTLPQTAAAQQYDRVISLEAGPELPFKLKEAFLSMQPGTVVELPEGKFQFDDELVLNTSHVTLRGKGPDKTVLSFKGQPQGAQGLLVLSNAFTVEDLAVEDSAGDGIRVEGANGAVFRRIRVEWTAGPDEENGGYGIYPVLCRNVLVEDSVVIGASDAGIYVGQSQDIIVRRNRAEYNVAGIEIENSINADVYDNVATHNTGGILVFDMPNLTQAGHHTRVFNNQVVDNNTKNFAPKGNIVGKVPTGTGVMVLSTDNVDVFDNVIKDNKTTNFTVTSFKSIQLLDGTPLPEQYDPYPEFISFRNNQVDKPFGWAIDGGDFTLLANLLFMMVGQPVADIVVDGWYRTDLENAYQCFDNNRRPNGALATFGNIQLNKSHWLLKLLGIPGTPAKMGYEFYHRCQNEPFGPATLDFSIFDEIPPPQQEYTAEEIAAFCSGGDAGSVNWGATVVNCPTLSSYRLFSNPQDPRSTPAGARSAAYDLTTPLFTDYANKYRAVYVPEGAQIQYTEQGPFDFPVGSIIAKTFTLPLSSGVEQVVETRLLMRRAAGWVALPYRWREDMSDADLALGGAQLTAEVIDSDGDTVEVNYRVPNANQCTSCHAFFGKNRPIGPKAQWLNRPYAFAPDHTANQLVEWQQRGLLAVTDEQLASAPRQPVWNDEADGSVEQRARAYLDINCAHCHSIGGRAYATGLYLSVSTAHGITTGVCKPPVSAGTGTGNLNFDVVPGNPDESILMYRVNSNDAAIRMPELGRSVVHTQGSALIEQWIEEMTGACEATP